MSSKERPIIFSGPMVRAILEGRKTQTRRVIKKNASGRAAYRGRNWHLDDPNAVLACPYGQPGDLLYVRETWCHFPKGAPDGMGECVYYRASHRDDDTKHVRIMEQNGVRWKPSIHMPKKYARIWLEVTGVRVERVQDINEDDAKAEGIENVTGGAFGYKDYEGDTGATFQPWQSFSTLWDSINAKRGYGWDENPWVWVIEFRRSEAAA